MGVLDRKAEIMGRLYRRIRNRNSGLHSVLTEHQPERQPCYNTTARIFSYHKIVREADYQDAIDFSQGASWGSIGARS